MATVSAPPPPSPAAGAAPGRLRAARGERPVLVAVIALTVAFAVFFALPLVGLVERALREDGTWDVITSALASDALALTLWTATLTTVIAVVIGTPVAYLLARGRFPGRAALDLLVDLPIVLPPTVAGVALLTAFGRRGLLGDPLHDLTGVNLALTTTAVILAQLLVATPFYVRAAKSGIEAVDPQYERVAYTLGASRLRAFLRVVAPLARPSLLAGVVLCWARAVGELGATLIFAGNLQGRTQTMPLAILQAFDSASLGLPGAVALSVLLLAVAVIVLAAFRIVTRRLVAA